ncbi:cupredoxin domain-containing protein [Methyloceanibacter sp.]|uniref:cupredoxin domain-containing protein n=1 Tax=Methyloceanibacter sp. TaxID=1965321 RepID=UPI003D6C71C2
MTIAFGAAMAAGLILFYESSVEAGAVRVVGIEFRDSEGNFFFKKGDADIEMNVGDTVKWEPEGGRHHMVADSPASAFEETIDFTKINPQERTFDKAVEEIKYHCIRHPDTMIGTIKVKAAETGK